MTIIIQGAMDEELDVLLAHFAHEEKAIGGYRFYTSNYKGHKIVISKTEVGVMNAGIATTIAINEFCPDLVINQGCAGSHIAEIANGELIIGEKIAYINCFNTNPKQAGEGSNSLEWHPSHKRSYVLQSTPKYVKLAASLPFDGKRHVGTLGSGDLYSREVDRINFLHQLFGELCEDMESVACVKACEAFSVDRLALRIISNNEITQEEFDIDVCRTLQKFVIELIDKIIFAAK